MAKSNVSNVAIPAVEFLGELITNIVRIDEDKDGKVEGMEILSFGQKTVFSGFRNFAGFNLKDFKSELSAIWSNPESKKALISAFEEKFDLDNDILEFLIEDTINYLDEGATLIGRWKKVTSNDVPAKVA